VKITRKRLILLIPLALFALVYARAAVMLALRDDRIAVLGAPSRSGQSRHPQESNKAHLGQRILYGFFSPIGVAVKAEQIGKAMIEVTVRSKEFANGDKLGTRSIIRYADAYDRRTRQ
jgi:hypothetical protein